MNNVILCGGGLDTAATLAWLSKIWSFDRNPVRGMHHYDVQVLSHRIPKLRREDKLTLLVVNYGQVAFANEEQAVTELRNMMFHDFEQDVEVMTTDVMPHVLDLNPLGGLLFGDKDVPTAKLRGRNLALAMCAAQVMQDPIDHLYFCMTYEPDVEMPADTSEAFIRNMDQVFLASELSRRVISPLVASAKSHVLNVARMWYPQLFDVAFSCWIPQDGKPCGECRHCIRFEKFRGEGND